MTMRQDYGGDWRQRWLCATRRMIEPWRRTFRRPNGRRIDLLSLPVPGGGFVVTSTDIGDRLDVEAKAVAARQTAGRRPVRSLISWPP